MFLDESETGRKMLLSIQTSTFRLDLAVALFSRLAAIPKPDVSS
jgi:hypothetical protein